MVDALLFFFLFFFFLQCHARVFVCGVWTVYVACCKMTTMLQCRFCHSPVILGSHLTIEMEAREDLNGAHNAGGVQILEGPVTKQCAYASSTYASV